MTLALIWSKVIGFLKDVPIWIWILIVFAITLQWTKVSSYKKGEADKEREIRERQAEVQVAVTERVTELTTQEQTNATEALEARDRGEHFPTADSLPDELESLGIRNPGRS